MSSTEDDSGSSVPILPSDSPGSSVSTTLQDEYHELLKYALVAPHYDTATLPQSLTQAVHAFTNRPQGDELIFEDSSTASARTEESTSIEETLRGKESVQAVHGSNSYELSEETRGIIPRQHISERTTPLRLPLIASATPETPETDASAESESDLSRSSVMSPSIDQDLARMEANLDNWCLDLKRNILAEMSQSKISLIERHRHEIRALKDRNNREMNQRQNEIENLKELLHTYEVSIERKDGVVSNLTRALQRQKERFEMLRRFEAWKIRHSEDRREAFATKLAVRQRNRRLMNKVWDAWHSIIEAKWKQRVEKACQSKAQEVCMSLTNDYETRLASLNEALESSRSEVTRLHAEREKYEETMKKAFMRGVCALNLEAMTMFHENEENGDSRGGADNAPPHHAHPGPPDVPTAHTQPATHTYQAVPQPRTVTSQSAMTPSTITQGFVSGPSKMGVSSSKTTHSSKLKTITAKISTRQDISRAGSLGGVTLAPPMSSVMVERHHPITQQTIGHALASQYPVSMGDLPKGVPSSIRQPHPGHSLFQHQSSRQAPSQPSGGAQKRIAGQNGRAIHTVKVVQ